jgi:hypothetical protein
MPRYYHDERRAHEVGYLPNLVTEKWVDGWRYYFAQPGCLPDGDDFGPFDTEEEALEHARLDLEDEHGFWAGDMQSCTAHLYVAEGGDVSIYDVTPRTRNDDPANDLDSDRRALAREWNQSQRAL